MLKYLQYSACLLFCFFSVEELVATHNRAGEITYMQIDEVTIEATITTYTRTSSFSVDRDSLEMFWGDGTGTIIDRTEEVELDNDIKFSRYTARHIYPSRGTYTMSMVDPNRIAGILNIDFPNSVDIQFYIETTFTLLDQRFEGPNSSVILLQPPIDFACPDQPFTYNPNAFDPDGDSVSFQLITPFQMKGVEVPNYNLPNEIRPGEDNKIFLDPVTGDFLWDSPQIQGEFNITFLINEYRNGVLINSMVRDMQILVRSCPDSNTPPKIVAPDLVCVVAGEILEIPFSAYELDSGDIVSATIIGGPLELSPDSAYVVFENVSFDSLIKGSIIWQTNCNHIAEEYYKVVIRATDIRSRPLTALATLKTVLIKVVGPAPILTDVIKENYIVSLVWETPYSCDQDILFQGFSIWRREGTDNLIIDSCQGGLDNSGYERIVFLTNEIKDGNFFAQDAELEPGKIYCYRVVAEFALLTQAGNLYNRTASLPSDPICIRSSGEEPVITNVSVTSTDNSNGTIEIAWLLPDRDQIDTVDLIGPYLLSIEEGMGFTDPGNTSIEVQSGDKISDLTDTSHLSPNLNTVEGPFNYIVTFSSGDLAFPSDLASSIYLETNPSDESVQLRWNENVPWANYNYCIYQVLDNEMILIDSTTEQSYQVFNLQNGEEYCYLIQSKGRYGLKEVNEPLLNFSNSACSVPRDNVAPCAPQNDVSSICDDPSREIGQELINVISWSPCADDDLAGYRIYFSPDTQTTKNLLSEIPASDFSYDHLLSENIAGCYSISSFDNSGNESEIVNEICVDNCPTYVLPNAFTPNSDQSNDLFVPRVNQFIDRVDFEVYNRWGQKVWESADPKLNWEGKNFGDKDLAEGTYYYTCIVFERRVNGILESPEVLRGTIQLLR